MSDVSDDRLADRLRMLRQRLMAVFSASYVPASVRDTIPALLAAADALDEAAAEVTETAEMFRRMRDARDNWRTAHDERQAEVERLRAEVQQADDRADENGYLALAAGQRHLAAEARLAEQSDELATALAQLTALRGVRDAVRALCDRLLRESGVGPYETGVSVGDVLDALGDEGATPAPTAQDDSPEGIVQTYFDTVRSMTNDPDILAAIDKAEAQRRDTPGEAQ